MSARLFAGYPDGQAGVFATLRVMRDIVNEAKTDPEIMHAATAAVFLVPPKDELSEARAIFDMVRENVRYLKDVWNVETVTYPATTLKRRVGDCDDQVTLLCSLFESVGYPTRFVMTGYNTRDVFEHVYCQVLVAGQWVDCDPTEPQPMGYAPPNPVAYFLEN